MPHFFWNAGKGSSGDGLFVPSHLEVQGFYLLRARTQLREVANILLM
jgi:hypothetical protein